MSDTTVVIVASFVGGVVASIAPIVSSIFEYLNRRSEHTFNVDIQNQLREDRLGETRRLLYEECLTTAGEFLGFIERSRQGDGVAMTNAREARGHMLAAWSRYLREATLAERGIIRHFLGVATESFDSSRLYEATCKAVVQLADITTDDFGRQSVVVPTKTSITIIRADE